MSDPAGLLHKIPELALVATDPKIAAALASGSPHAVYRALLWGNWFGRFKAHQEAVNRMLNNRRLFVTDIAAAPGMFTLNGIGVKMYGETEQDHYFKTYVTTQFFTVIFIPIFPVAAYVASTEGHNSYRFYGKVPLSGTTTLWQYGTVAAALFAGFFTVTGSAVTAAVASRYDDLTVVNGLSVPVVAEIGSEKFTIPADSYDNRSYPVGTYNLRITDEAGKEIETGSVALSSDSSEHIWNVLGIGMVFDEEVLYGTSMQEPKVTSYCGQKDILAPRTDYLFVEPPEQISTSNKYGVTTRSHLGQIESQSGQTCLRYLLRTNPEQIATYADLLAATGQTKLADITGILEAHLGAEPATAWLEKHLAELDLDGHRLRQDLLNRTDRTAEAVQFYTERAKAQPDDADAQYLAARLAPDAKAVSAYQAVVAKFPAHPWTQRALAYALHTEGRFEEAIAAWDAAEKADPSVVIGDDHPRLESWIAAGKLEEAASFATHGSVVSSEQALARILALRQTGHANPETAVFSLLASPNNVDTVHLNGILSDQPVELAPFDGKLVYHPNEALAAINEVDSLALSGADPSVLILLEGELLARQDFANLDRLHAEVPGMATLSTYVLSPETWKDLPPTWVTMAHLARALQPDVPAEEKSALIQWVRKHDILKGPATAAMAARGL